MALRIDMQAIVSRTAPCVFRNRQNQTGRSARGMSAVPKRLLGNTGLEVSVLGFGASPLGSVFEVKGGGYCSAAWQHWTILSGLKHACCKSCRRSTKMKASDLCTKLSAWA